MREAIEVATLGHIESTHKSRGFYFMSSSLTNQQLDVEFRGNPSFAHLAW